MRTRRTFTSEFKAKIVLACISGEKTISELCREYQLSPVLVNKWRTEFINHSAVIFDRNYKGGEDQQQIAELERLVGRLTLENDILKKTSKALSTPINRNGT